MSKFHKSVEKYLGIEESKDNKKYCEVGHTFRINDGYIDGVYWFFETENFIINIHDFFIKKELIRTNSKNTFNSITFSASYIISANGESFNPYQTLTANSLYFLNVNDLDKNYHFLLHGNSPFLSVEINFKRQMLNEYISTAKLKKDISYSDIFINTNPSLTKPLEKISKDILNCTMTSPAAELFFEAKAREWISVVFDAFLNKKELKISVDDDKALKNVANYIDDHYTLNISQKTLEKIAMMSGTKLKKLFKSKYQCSITEYTQRKRMNIAENLLLNSTLKIQDIAKAVGYTSHSKFSYYFKKYKGVNPRDMQKYISKKN